MISEKQYRDAQFVIQQYEKEQAEMKKLREQAEMTFPIGISVYSKKNKNLSGRVIGYGAWNGITSLLLNNGRKILSTNAIIIK